MARNGNAPRKHAKSKKGKSKRAPILPPSTTSGANSIVIARGACPSVLRQVAADWRQTLAPRCAAKLKAFKRNSMKDFKMACTSLGASHLHMFTNTELGTYMRVMRIPAGPTLHFSVLSYTTAREIKSKARDSARGVAGNAALYTAPPVLVLNNFSGSDAPELKVVTAVLTGLLPPLEVKGLVLANCRRVLLFHRHSDTGYIDVRVYAVICRRAGGNKAVRRLAGGKMPRSLPGLEDVSELLTGAALSEHDSEVEAIRIEAPQTLSRHVEQGSQSSIRLVELGPRMTLSLRQVLAGSGDGATLWHCSEKRSAEEISSLHERHELRQREREAKQAEAKKAREERVAAKRATASGDSDVSMDEDSEQEYDATGPSCGITALEMRDIVTTEEGSAAEKGSRVKAHYTGWLARRDGERIVKGIRFDSSKGGPPFPFRVGSGQVIAGWDQGVLGMHPGAKRRLIIPPSLAYGDAGAGSTIPPGATLLFDIEMVSVENKAKAPAPKAAATAKATKKTAPSPPSSSTSSSSDEAESLLDDHQSHGNNDNDSDSQTREAFGASAFVADTSADVRRHVRSTVERKRAQIADDELAAPSRSNGSQKKRLRER